MLNVQCIRNETELAALSPEWEALDAQLTPRMPFTAPLWNTLWWKHFHRNGLACRDEMRVYVVRDEAGSLIGVAPMMLTHRPSYGPLRTRELQFFGADPYMTEARGPVCLPEHMLQVVDALSEQFEVEHQDWDWIQWRGLRKTEANSAEVEARLPQKTYAELADHYLEMPSDWETFKSALPRNIKESLRKCYNSLTRDGLAFEFRVVSDDVAMPGAVLRFLELHEDRASTAGTVDHLNVFEWPQTCAFLAEYAQEMSARGQIRVFQLVIKDVVVATRIGLVLGDEIYLYYSGYDFAWSKYSVMTTTVAEALKWSIGQGFRIVNLSTGTDVSKLRWRPQQIYYAGAMQLSTSARSQAAYAVVEWARNLKKPVQVADGADGPVPSKWAWAKPMLHRLGFVSSSAESDDVPLAVEPKPQQTQTV